MYSFIHSLNKCVLSNSFLQGPEVLGQAENQRHLAVRVPGFKAEISRGYQGLCSVPGERKRRQVGCHESTQETHLTQAWGLGTHILELKSNFKVIQFKLFILQTGQWLGWMVDLWCGTLLTILSPLPGCCSQSGSK